MNITEWALEICGPRLRKAGLAYAFVWSIAHTCDAVLDGVSWAQLSRFLQHAPADALYHAGRDRVLVRGASETDDQWRERLASAWTAWVWAGTTAGLRAQLAAVLPTQVAITFFEGSWWFGVLLTPADQTWRDASVTSTVRQILKQFRPAHVVARHVAVEGTLLAWGHHGGTSWGDGWPGPAWNDDAAYLVEDTRAV